MTGIRSLVASMALITGLWAPALLANDTADLQRFAERMSGRHDMDAGAVMQWLNASQRRQSILDAIASPAESLPWHRYRGIFLKSSRIKAGAAFWRSHRDLLARAQSEYGVPARVIVAILGVESRYGRNVGGHRVIDALRTLAFHYPPRAGFFKDELEAYLLLTRDQGINPLEPKGSYAGAMGMPQFIASSYRAYAIDFNGNGQIDLWDETEDVVGSVANYLAEHGWRRGKPVISAASVSGEDWRAYDTSGLKPNTSVATLRDAGITLEADYSDDGEARLLALDGGDGKAFWVARRNFYVITRYNHSALYALAVHQLGNAIQERLDEG